MDRNIKRDHVTDLRTSEGWHFLAVLTSLTMIKQKQEGNILYS